MIPWDPVQSTMQPWTWAGAPSPLPHILLSLPWHSSSLPTPCSISLTPCSLFLTRDVAPGAPLSKSLEGVTIYKSDGTPVPVLSLWKDKKAVVAWVRHYG